MLILFITTLRLTMQNKLLNCSVEMLLKFFGKAKATTMIKKFKALKQEQGLLDKC